MGMELKDLIFDICPLYQRSRASVGFSDHICLLAVRHYQTKRREKCLLKMLGFLRAFIVLLPGEKLNLVKRKIMEIIVRNF